MKRSYLLVYSDTLGTREQVKKVINELPEVITWRYDLPYSFYLISEYDAKTLASRIRESLGNKGRLVVSEVGSENRWGWLTPETWYLLKNKRVKPKG